MTDCKYDPPTAEILHGLHHTCSFWSGSNNSDGGNWFISHNPILLVGEIANAIDFFKSLRSISGSEKVRIGMGSSFRMLNERTLGVPPKECS